MRILDSNIIIYATQSNYSYLLPLLQKSDSYVSEIIKLEVLGYHKFSDSTKQDMTILFSILNIIPIDSAIIDKAIEFRQLKKMSTGDSIIAATASINSFEIVTRNLSDFSGFSLKIFNPISNT